MACKPIKLVPKQPAAFTGADHELYTKVNELIWDRIDGLTCIGAIGVLEYIKHEVMHVAINAELEDE